MCCGYFTKFTTKKIDIAYFYHRRYGKILPFFTFLIFVALLVQHNNFDLYEGLMELTLLFGLLPNNNLGVLGVSWTLGVIFVFYFLFPFFSYLLMNKLRAWTAFIISLVVNYLCSMYFFSAKFVIPGFVPRHTFIYCAPFFMLGGMFYLYRDKLLVFVKNRKIIILFTCCFFTVIYYMLPDTLGNTNIFVLKQLVLLGAWFIYSIGNESSLFNNKFLNYFSSISMEMYLAQMIIFRIIQKMNLLYFFGNGMLSLIFIFILEVIGLVFFIEGYRFFFKKIIMSLKRVRLRFLKNMIL